MGGGSAHLAVAANVPHEHRLIRAARCHRGTVRRELDGVDRIAVALQQHDGRVERGRAVPRCFPDLFLTVLFKHKSICVCLQ